MKKLIGLGVVGVLLTLTACNNNPLGNVSLPSSPLSKEPVNTSATQQSTAAVNSHAVANQVVTVAQLKDLPDDSMVRLRGKVVKALHDEKYEFADDTGTVVVEIDREVWQGRAVSANEVLTLVGELDKELNPMQRLKVDVEMIEF